jgi:hypothetical protein
MRGKFSQFHSQDGEHKLDVFKYDPRVDARGGVPQYLTHPAMLSHLAKEFFTVETLICSTMLTQNPDLRNLLKWRLSPSNMELVVRRTMYIGGEEVVKSLTDIFDAVFGILDA